MTDRLQALAQNLSGKTVLVLGDVILDEYITGEPTRMSREAPVPVLEHRSTRYIAGGAANPAANIQALGSYALQAGIVGDDEAGERLRSMLRQQGIDTGGLLRDGSRPTTVKTRILAQLGLRFPQQVTRIDQLVRRPISAEIAAELETFVAQQSGLDAILLSHYHGGLLKPQLVQALRRHCRQRRLLLSADVQGQFATFAGVDVIKCNAADTKRYLQRELRGDADFSRAAEQLYQQLDLQRAAIITRGQDGATLATAAGSQHIPAPQVSDVYDTVGAGDTAIAVLTLALAAGGSHEDAVRLATVASGIVVRYMGNYCPSLSEVLHALAG